MKNAECTIYLTTRRGWTQTYRKGKDGWEQTTNGVVRPLSAEQLLSHLLPVLAAGNSGRATVRVVPDRRKPTRASRAARPGREPAG